MILFENMCDLENVTKQVIAFSSKKISSSYEVFYSVVASN